MSRSPLSVFAAAEGERASATIAAFLLFALLPPLTVPAFRSATLMAGLALVVSLVGLRKEEWKGLVAWPKGFEGRVIAGSLVLFLALAAFSLLWTPDVSHASEKLMTFALLVFGLVVLASAMGPVSGKLAIAFAVLGAGTAAVLMTLELMKWTTFHRLVEPRAYLYDLNRTAALLAFMLPAMGLAVVRGWVPRLPGAVVALGMVAVIAWSQSQSAQLALLATAAGFAIAMWRPAIPPLALLVAACVLLAPAIPERIAPALDRVEGSAVREMHAEHRLAIWQGYADLIGERPLLGHGFRASRALGMNGAIAHRTLPLGLPPNTDHPHNAALEIWVDLGLVGALLAAGAIGALLLGLRHVRGRPERAACVALALGAVAFSSTANGLYQGWWIASVGAGAILLRLLLSPRAPAFAEPSRGTSAP